MSTIHLKDYSNTFKSSPLHKMIDKYGDSCTDTSTWRPDISIVRAQQGQAAGKQLLYDFKDGKDSGETIQTFIRTKGLDITEIESAEKRITQIIEDKKLSDKEKKEAADRRKELLDAIKGDKEDTSTQPDSNPQPTK